MSSALRTKAKLEDVLAEVQAIQKDIGKVTNQSVGLNSQLTENQLVKQEMVLLSDDSVVYKLVGPVLIKQDLLEAKGNVDKRITFINGELKKLEDQTKSLESKQEAKRKIIVDLQQKLQQQVQQGTIQ